jgi:hypothetical protein
LRYKTQGGFNDEEDQPVAQKLPIHYNTSSSIVHAGETGSPLPEKLALINPQLVREMESLKDRMLKFVGSYQKLAELARKSNRGCM